MIFTPDEIRARYNKLLEQYSGTHWFEKRDYDIAPLTEDKKVQLAMLMENQKNKLNEYTTSSMIKPLSTFQLPMIRRIYPNLVAQDLVGIQVLPQPSGSIWYFDHHYDTDVAPVRRGDRMDMQTGREGANVNDARNYTKGYARGAIIGVGDGTRVEYEIPRLHTPYSDTKFTPVHPNQNLQIYVDSVPRPIKFEGTPTGAEVLVVYQTGDLVFGTAPLANVQITADYDLRMEGDDSRIPELAFSLRSETITTERRKLKARWTLEAEQDLQAYHGMSVEAELTAMAAREIQQEIDREIMFDLLDSASENVNWVSTWPGDTSGYTRNEYDETLVRAIYEAESRIHRKRRVLPNWLVTSSDVAVRLQAMSGFQYAGGIEGGTIGVGPRRQGTFRSRYNVIVDPLFPANTMLLGYKGQTMQEAGYLYCPYVGLIGTETIMDPHDFTPRKGWMRRDGKKLISGDFYATVTITS